MQRVLVTGGAGFLGTHLCRRLLRQGHEVVVVDSLLTSSRRNVRDLLSHRGFTLVKGDVTRDFAAAVGSPLHRIYNLACPASPSHYQKSPIHTTLTSVLGAHHCLRIAERTGARMLQASTSEVYGDPAVHPQTESYRGDVSSIGPRACYDEGKRCAEALAMDYHRTRGVEVRIARIFNTYGPCMAWDDGRVVSNFIVQALRNEPVTVYGNGAQTRSLCYVDDMIDGLMGLMEQKVTTGPVNLGNPRELTVLEIAELVIHSIGHGTIVKKPLPVDDPKRRNPDITLARTLFGFEPKVPFETGLEKTVEYFRGIVGDEEPLVVPVAPPTVLAASTLKPALPSEQRGR